MSRKYEVARIDVMPAGLGVTVLVYEVGPTWKFCVKIPWALLADPEDWALLQDSVARYEALLHRQREKLDDSLF